MVSDAEDTTMLHRDTDDDIAIVGMSCRLPGNINNYKEFWDALTSATDTRQPIPSTRWNNDVYHSKAPKANPALNPENPGSEPGKILPDHSYFLADIAGFDPSFFGISPREAPAIDPQQRLLLELAWESFEDAGLDLDDLKGSRTGVFVGLMNQDYSLCQSDRVTNGFSSTGLSFCIAANRISYSFDLRGPSLALDTACSASAVCMQMALESLRRGETNMCLAGGVNLTLQPKVFVALSQLQVLSRDGRSKAFDASGDGYARSEGGGLLVLKRLRDAQRDGDRIHGVICGVAVNQDGRSSVPITSPNRDVQVRVLEDAYKNANIPPNLVGYVESHGTGTARGDMTEANALVSFFLRNSNRTPDMAGNDLNKDVAALDRTALLRVGSAKTNVGHLEPAAGVIGVIKAVLCLKYQAFVPSLHFHKFPEGLDAHPLLRLQTENQTWVPMAHDGKAARLPRFAGVNSFGYGGTNSHVVLMEHVPSSRPLALAASSSPAFILPLSAHSKTALDALIQSHATFLRKNEVDGEVLYNYCYTASVRRTHFNFRVAACGTDRVALIAALDSLLDRDAKSVAAKDTYAAFEGKKASTSSSQIIFVTAGQGSQHFSNSLSLMGVPVFASHMNKIDAWVRTHKGWSLIDTLQAVADKPAAEAWSLAKSNTAIFAIQTAIGETLTHMGVTPHSVLGHSVGELAASYFSRSITLEACLEIIWAIADIISSTMAGKGQLLDVRGPIETIMRVVNESGRAIDIACMNSHTSVTLAGTFDDIALISEKLREAGVTVNASSASKYPFHSHLMDPLHGEVLQQVQAALDKLQRDGVLHPSPSPSGRPQADVLSTARNQRLAGIDVAKTLADASYWWDNLRNTVSFLDQVQGAARNAGAGSNSKLIMVELSPRPALSPLIVECTETMGKDIQPPQLLYMHTARTLPVNMMAILAQLHVIGHDIAWANVYPEGCISEIPAVQLQREPFWVESVDSFRGRMGLTVDDVTSRARTSKHTLLGMFTLKPSYENIMEYHAQVLPAEWPLAVDHVFEGSMLIPGSFYVETFLGVSKELCWNVPFSLKDVHFLDACWLDPDYKYNLMVRVKNLDQGTFAIQFLSYNFPAREAGPAGKPTYTLHAKCMVSFGKEHTLEHKGVPMAAPEWNNLIAQAPTTYSYERWNTEFIESGFAYGPRMKLVRNVYGGNNSAVVDLNITDIVHEEILELGYVLHPGLIDTATQGIAAGAAGTISSSLPVYCREVYIDHSVVTAAEYDMLQKGMWANVTDIVMGQGREEGDVYVYSRDGRLKAAFLGFKCKSMSTGASAAPSKKLKSKDTPLPLETCYYNLDWTPVAPAPALDTVDDGLSQAVIIIAPDQDHKDTAALITASFKGVHHLGTVIPYDKVPEADTIMQNLAGLVASQLQAFSSTSGEKHLTFAVVVPDFAHYLRRRSGGNVGPDEVALSMDAQHITREIDTLSHWILVIMQAVHALQDGYAGLVNGVDAPSMTMVFLTHGMVSATRDVAHDSVSSLIQSPLPGYVRVCNRENAFVPPRILDVQSLFREMREARAQPDKIAAWVTKVLAEIANHQSVSHMTIVTPSLETYAGVYENQPFIDPLKSESKIAIRSDATYVFIGGTGSFGLAIAEWMASKGARHFALVSRSGVTEANIPALHRLEQALKGGRVTVYKKDVTDTQHVAELFESLARDMPPVRGMFNMAMVLRDAMINKQTHDNLTTVLRPKVLSTLLLQDAVARRGVSLDFFILFSSTTSLFGNAGQFPYAGANSFLDAFPTFAAKNDLPCITVNWPPVSGIGFLQSNQTVEGILFKHGWRSFSPDDVMGTVDQALRAGRSNLGVLSVYPARFIETSPEITQHQVWAKVYAHWVQESYVEAQNTSEAQPASVDVMGLVASILGQNVAQVDPDQGLTWLGIDSLTAMEIRNKISHMFKVDIPIAILLQHDTSLRDIERRVSGSSGTTASSSTPSSSSSSGAVKVADITGSAASAGVDAAPKTEEVQPEDDEQLYRQHHQLNVWGFQGPSPQALKDNVFALIKVLEAADSKLFDLVCSNSARDLFDKAGTSTTTAPYRAGIACYNADSHQGPGLLKQLRALVDQPDAKFKVADPNRSCIFAFSGQGTQYLNMSKGLYHNVEVYRRHVDTCSNLIKLYGWMRTPEGIPQKGHFDLLRLLFPQPSSETAELVALSAALNNTEFSQPAIFVVEYALAMTLQECGLKPALMLGHSLGEYVAALLAGVMNLHDCLKLVCVRGRAMSSCTPGSMVAIKAPEPAVEALIAEFNATRPTHEAANCPIEICVLNSSDQTVAGGDIPTVGRFIEFVKAKGMSAHKLNTSHAFHSSSMTQAKQTLLDALAEVTLRPPVIPYVSNLSGTLITPQQATNPNYYWMHMCKTVRFIDNLTSMLEFYDTQPVLPVFVEIGMGNVLTALAQRRVLIKHPEALLVSSLPKNPVQQIPGGTPAVYTGTSETQVPLASLSVAWTAGVNVDIATLARVFHLESTVSANLTQLSLSQQRIWFMEQLRPNDQAYNMSTTYLVHAHCTAGEVETALKRIMIKHPILRASVQIDADHVPYNKIHDIAELDFQLAVNSDFVGVPLAKVQPQAHHAPLTTEGESILHALKEFSLVPFTLSQGPLLRFIFIPLAGYQAFILHFVFHHIIMDASSGTVFSRELLQNLNAAENVVVAREEGEELSFMQLAQWERAAVRSVEYMRRLAYWRKQLSQTDYAQLPTNPRVATARQQGLGCHYNMVIGDQLAERVRTTAQSLGVTLASFLATATSLLLFRFSDGGKPISLGLAETHRPPLHPNVANTIGCFTNMLVLRSSLHMDDPSFQDLARHYHTLMREALDHSYPFSDLVRHLSLINASSGTRRPGQAADAGLANVDLNPIFQVLFNFRSFVHKESPLFQQIFYDNLRAAQFDLEVVFDYDPPTKVLSGKLVFDQARMAPQRVEMLSDAFTTLLEALCATPNQSLSQYPLLSPKMASSLVTLWNPVAPVSQNPPPTPRSIHERFISVAQRHPDKVAIVDEAGNHPLTFAQVHHLATALANAITKLTPRDKTQSVCVGVFIHREVSVPVACLGSLMAGFAYLPLCPDFYPEARLRSVVTDSNTSVIVTTSSHRQTLLDLLGPLAASIHVIVMDELSPTPQLSASPVVIGDDSVAYVEYTSGSTGKPKGVLVTHKNVLSLFDESQGSFDFNFTSHSVTLLFHSFAFDLHAWEIWGTWLAGGHLVALKDPRDVSNMLNVARNTKVTHISLTPSVFRWLARFAPKDAPSSGASLDSLEMVNLCGEKLEFSLLKEWYAKFPPHKPVVVNSYGITETTVISTYKRLDPTDASCTTSMIGMPIPNNRFYVLDEGMRVVPPDVPGELWVAGDAVALGYIGNPELTAQRFLPNHIDEKANGTKLYKTGDQGYFDLVANEFVFMGRIDNQIKVAGLRAEPQEIEAHIIKVQGVNAAVVAPVQPPHTDHKVLVAYVVLQDETSDPSAKKAAILAHLARSVPPNMVPKDVLFLTDLPMTRNLKVDRKLLSEYTTYQKAQGANPTTTAPEVQPPSRTSSIVVTNSIHHQLLEIWKSILGVSASFTSSFAQPGDGTDSEINIDNMYMDTDINFFDVGGSSLQAFRLVHTINKWLNCDLPVSVIYTYPTVFTLAEYIKVSGSARNTPLVRLTSTSDDPHDETKDDHTNPPVILVHPAGGGVIQYLTLTKAVQLKLKLNTDLTPKQKDQTFYGLERVHEFASREELLTCYGKAIQGQFSEVILVGYSLGGVISYELARWLLERGVQVRAIVFVDCQISDAADLYTDCDILLSLVNYVKRLGLISGDVDWNRATGDELFEKASQWLRVEPFNNADFLKNFVRGFRQDIELWNGYEVIPAAELADTPLHFFAAGEDHLHWVTPWKKIVPDMAVTVIEHANHHSIIGDAALSLGLIDIVHRAEQSAAARSGTDQPFSVVVQPAITRFQQLANEARKIPPNLKPSQQIQARVPFLSKRQDDLDIFEPAPTYTSLLGYRLKGELGFDTGTAGALPFGPFVTAYVEQASQLDTFRHYMMDSSSSRVSDDIVSFFYKMGILSSDSIDPTLPPIYSSSDFAAMIGTGTTNILQVLFRKLIIRRGDMVLVPSVSYGLLFPQIELAIGDVHFISPQQQNNFLVTPAQLESEITLANEGKRSKWLINFVPAMWTFLTQMTSDPMFSAQAPRWGVDLHPDAMRALFALANEVAAPGLSPSDTDRLLEVFIEGMVLQNDVALVANFRAFHKIRLPTVPRVVAMLHVNPSVFGSIYTIEDIAPLAHVFKKHNVAVVEDFAYALLELQNTRRVHSLLPFIPNVYLVLGISKPFAIANVRVGLLVGHRDVVPELKGYVSISVGHVSSMAQNAVHALITAPVSELQQYLSHNAYNPEDGYLMKRDVMIGCLEGTTHTKHFSPEARVLYRHIIGQHVRSFLSHIEHHLDSPEHPQWWPYKFQSRTIQSSVWASESMVEHMCTIGLSKYFKVVHCPEGGFFIIVDTSRLIRRSHGKTWALSSSFDVNLMLIHLFGLKTIPEEMMGTYVHSRSEQEGDISPDDRVWLRFSFSPTVKMIVWSLFVLSVGLQALEDDRLNVDL
eukprot:TRINITY_DN2319_c0_g1_i4.p1 TRINITY_DN2319_c0_g1~~TRINITY_DN2319_c0_g1_i4.p1  ORF type:complete len:4577 (-),score=1291.43 TRINITY_DN2319_c0_g1_i4:35-13765(-)